jgi:bacterioferritin-associated ferredoxin
MSLKSPLLDRPDFLVCTCFGIMHSEIVKAIEDGADSFDALQESLLVGTGCSSCVSEIRSIVQEVNTGNGGRTVEK